MTSSTQAHLQIEDIKNNLVFLKDGSVIQVLETTAVNFGLLFETEQAAIIDSFAGMLNSLSFPIQIIIRSKRLDVSSYLGTLDKALLQQTNPLMKTMIARYRTFVESLIKENEVLDKNFYICVLAGAVEFGVLPKGLDERSKKAIILLKPRVDHILRQLMLTGLKGRALESAELIKLYYDVYNNSTEEGLTPAAQLLPKLNPQPTSQTPSELPPNLEGSQHQNLAASLGPQILITSHPPSRSSPINSASVPAQPSSQPPPYQRAANTPFVVEELSEN